MPRYKGNQDKHLDTGGARINAYKYSGRQNKYPAAGGARKGT